MTEDTAVLEKREELKGQLAAGAYNTELMKWVDRTGHLIQKLSRNPEPPSYWFSAVVLVLVILLIDSVISLLLGEFQQTAGREFMPLELTAGALLCFVLIFDKISFVSIFRTQREHLLDSITSISDLSHLQQWLKSLSSSNVLFFGLLYGIIITGIMNYLIVVPRVGFISPGVIFASLLGLTLMGMWIYHTFQLLFWMIGLGGYQLKLYPAAPSRSEIIDRLSDMIRKVLYLQAVLGVAITLAFTANGITTRFWLIFLIIAVWSPTITFFIIGQYSLSNIITNAKWQKLNQIQTRVERLEAEANIEDKDTMETINRLMEYHNQILKTPNSALNIRASLNFLNSLLLPVLAFVLANLDKLLALF